MGRFSRFAREDESTARSASEASFSQSERDESKTNRLSASREMGRRPIDCKEMDLAPREARKASFSLALREARLAKSERRPIDCKEMVRFSQSESLGEKRNRHRR